MLTQNYANLITSGYMNKMATYNGNHPWSCKTTAGVSYTDVFAGNANDRVIKYNIHIGAGTTTPTKSDYVLENELTTALTIVQCDLISSGGTVGFYATIYNDTNTSFDFTECGFSANMSKSNSDIGNVLLTRDVFDTITIFPNETISLFVKIA